MRPKTFGKFKLLIKAKNLKIKKKIENKVLTQLQINQVYISKFFSFFFFSKVAYNATYEYKIKKIIRTSKDTMIVILFLFLKSLCNNFLSGQTISKYFQHGGCSMWAVVLKFQLVDFRNTKTSKTSTTHDPTKIMRDQLKIPVFFLKKIYRKITKVILSSL